MQLPVEDKFYATKNEMKENIVVLLGGRVAEELTLDDISTGASNDLERVSATARNMVTKYGMIFIFIYFFLRRFIYFT